jgi:undecaprenyl diphosphate synthase
MPDEHAPDRIHPILDIPWRQVPRHIAIIMDGNGRWAQSRGRPRLDGHRAGSKVVRSIVTEATRLGIECLTLYSFSTENWKRPPEEVAGLMDLYRQYLINERPTIMNHNVRVRHLGDEARLPEPVLHELRETVRISSTNTGMYLCLALNYSGREELVRTIRRLAREVREDGLDPEGIDEDAVSARVDTAGLPDPDLLIRTAGERRISNFLLWQISYAELYVTETAWPDFSPEVLRQAILDYSRRDRRFGGLHPDQR